MPDNKTVMDYDSSTISFDAKIQNEYNEAVKRGFQGTKEQYYEIRDYV